MSFISTMLGKEYPFFLSNESFGEMYYLYQIYSPGLCDDLVPTFSLTKTNEKVDKSPAWGVDANNEPLLLPNGKDSDILLYLIGPKKGKKQYSSFLKTMLRKEGVEIFSDKNGFPNLKMVTGDRNSLQKTVIIYLRDALRWKSYSFKAGKKIELLYSPTEFIVFEFKENEDQELYVEPIAAFKNYDVEMRNPLKVDFSKITCPVGSWSKEKFSDMNKTFKLYEWESFTRRDIAPRIKR